MIILLLPVISIAACNCSQTNTKSVTIGNGEEEGTFLRTMLLFLRTMA
jgi:hypothetical protein